MKRSLGLLLSAALISCSPSGRLGSDPTPDVLRVGVLPDQSAEVLRTNYRPLLAYLQQTTGIECQLVIPDSYHDLVDSFAKGSLQLGWFGGLTFVRAESGSGAVPLVMRDVDLEFTTDFLVASSASGRSMEEFAGAVFSFGPRLSTSGHLMPRYFLGERQINPEKFFKEVRFSSGHDASALQVQNGEIDVAAANTLIVKEMFRDGRLDGEKVRVLERTPPYRNYVWAVAPDLDPGVRLRLLNAFLALDRTDSEHEKILGALRAAAFLPASRSHYDELRVAAEFATRPDKSVAR